MQAIDYNRGVRIRSHPSGVQVYMYNDEPGVFLNAFGHEVADALAQAAGYDVASLGRERLKKERMAQAMSMIENELSSEGTTEETLLVERRGFKIIGIGLGRFHLKDPDDNTLTPTPVSEEVAMLLLDQMAPEVEIVGELVIVEDEGIDEPKPEIEGEFTVEIPSLVVGGDPDREPEVDRDAEAELIAEADASEKGVELGILME